MNPETPPFPEHTDLERFRAWIKNFPYVICFVHSLWSMTSHLARIRFNQLREQFPNLIYLEIDNRSGHSFIYDWLNQQRGQLALRADFLGKEYPRSMIHGNGEIFGVRNGNLEWFESSLNFISMEELKVTGWLDE